MHTSIRYDTLGRKTGITDRDMGAWQYCSGSPKTSYRYTGQRWDSGTGLYWHRSRWYDPKRARFIQPDTIVPEPGNPQSLNRYAYVNNNPLRFADPSGYDPLDAAWQEEFRAVHGREPSAEDVLIRLFSIAFPDEWDWNAFYTSDGQLREKATGRIFTRVPTGRNWTSMPGATSRLAGWYTHDETEMFIRDIGSLFGGLATRLEQPNGWGAVTGGRVPNRSSVFIGPEGLPDEYLGNDLTGNVHHWAWSLNLGFFTNALVGRAINEGREFDSVNRNWVQFMTNPNSRADVKLGNIGVSMGDYMNGWLFGPRPPQALRNAWIKMPLTVSAQ